MKIGNGFDGRVYAKAVLEVHGIVGAKHLFMFFVIVRVSNANRIIPKSYFDKCFALTLSHPSRIVSNSLGY
jgi:hypothetical protein